MLEGRAHKRRHLIYYLAVHDQEDGKLLGHLVDITTHGIKLVSKHPLPPREMYQLRMALPEDLFAEKELLFQARPLWTNNDVNPDFYDTGFEISGLAEEAQRLIAELIDQLGFRD